MRPASRVARLVALWLFAVTLSIGWLLLRRRTRRGPLLRAVPDLPADPVPQPRAARAAGTDPRLAGPELAGGEPAVAEPAEPRRPEPVTALRRPVHDAAAVGELRTAPAKPTEATPPDTGSEPAAPTAAVEEPVQVAEPAPTAEVGESKPEAEPEFVAGPAPTARPAASGDSAAEPERADDLRRIRGIGPAIESSLHGLGIRSYRQLVLLDEAGLDRIRDAGRDFRQRIEREDWIGQARRLHREKYGEEV